MDKVYIVVMEWDGDSPCIETSVAGTKEKAQEIIKNYLENDESINDLMECCKEMCGEDNEDGDIFFGDDCTIEDDYVHLNDGDNICCIYIEEKEIQ